MANCETASRPPALGRRRWRTSTVAAVASAVSAALSAAVAAGALCFSLEQANIAEQQLDATYLSNLYNGQLKYLSSLNKSVIKLTNMVRDDHILDDNSHGPGELNSFQDRMVMKEELYIKAHSEVFSSLRGAQFILPREVQTELTSATGYSANILEAIRAFSATTPTQESWLRFTSKIGDAQAQLGHWNKIATCLGDALATGRPIQAPIKGCG